MWKAVVIEQLKQVGLSILTVFIAGMGGLLVVFLRRYFARKRAELQLGEAPLVGAGSLVLQQSTKENGMNGQYGIQETKEALKLVFAGFKVAQDANADGKVDLNDLGHVIQLVPLVGPAFGNIGQVPKEFADLSTEEGAELIAFTAAELNLTSPKAKIFLVYGLKALKRVVEQAGDVKAMKAELALVG